MFRCGAADSDREGIWEKDREALRVTDAVKCNREEAKGTVSGASWWVTIVRLFNVGSVSLIFA